MRGNVRRSVTGGLVVPLVVVASACGPSVAWLAARTPTVEPESSPVAASERSLTVMSYNIHHGVGADGTLDLDRVAATIAGSGAEVVALQEVDRHFSSRSGWADQAGVLARRLGMHLAFGPALDLDPLLPGQPRRQYGNAVLSRFPILGSENTLLPRVGTSEQRAVLAVRAAVRGIPLLVYATHLQNDAPAERQLQVDAIAAMMGAAPTSAVLLGDLNAEPGSPEVATLLARLVDAWLAAGVGSGETFSVSDPRVRIDYVLLAEDVVARFAMVVVSDASDHFGVDAEVVLPLERLGIGRRLDSG